MSSPAEIVLVIAGTALLSSLLTAGVTLLAVRTYLRRRLEETSSQLAARVRQGFEEAGDELLPRFRQEVTDGFGDAADLALPRFRAEVREGFKEALTETLGPRVLGKAREDLVRKGSSVLDAGLSLIFGADEEDR
jgi:hypothetical protein